MKIVAVVDVKRIRVITTKISITQTVALMRACEHFLYFRKAENRQAYIGGEYFVVYR